MLQKIQRLNNWQAGLILAVVGFLVYCDSLKNQFLGDDESQIVTNPVIHSISHIRLFFEGGTFYVGNGIAPLQGSYFRPLMTTVFSVIYSIFGPHPIYFHLFQLSLCIGSSILLYMVFRYSFKPVLSLFLALVFLLHPIDSQVVFALASMQDALFFFFGILGIWMLLRYDSIKALSFAALSFFMALLAKETAVLFVVVAAIYLLWWKRHRLLQFIGIVSVPTILWFVLRLNAIGVNSNPGNAPIDKLDLAGRLMTAPSIYQLYLTRLLFPLKLAHAYYWVYPKYSVTHVLVPLIFDLIALAAIVFAGLYINRHATKAMFYTYLFFSIWFLLGLATSSQIIALDLTASETWFNFSMAGLLGMFGVFATAIRPKVYISQHTLLVIMICIIAILGIRTAVRGTDWTSWYNISYRDVKVSKEDFHSDYVISNVLENQNNAQEALIYAQRSVQIYGEGDNYGSLAFANYQLGNYTAAKRYYLIALGQFNPIANKELYDKNLDVLMLSTGTIGDNIAMLQGSLPKLADNANIWFDLAILQYKAEDKSDAKQSISQAYKLDSNSPLTQSIYSIIMNDQQLPSTL